MNKDKRNTLQGLLTAVLLCAVSLASAQELTVKSFTAAPTDISASLNPRQDLNDNPCGLVKVQLAVAGAQFEGNVIAPVEDKTGEYWVYMTEGSKELVVKTPSTVPLHIRFGDYQIRGIVPKTTYVLTLSASNVAEQQTGTLTIRYSPSSAMVLIDSKPYQGTNGVVSVTLPVGAHDYIVAANDYETLEGSVKVKANQTVNLPLTLSPDTFLTTTISQQDVLANATAIDTTYTSTISPPIEVSTNPSSQTFTVKGVSFTMIRVDGGTFTKGATSEQGSDAGGDEKPAHQVTHSSYYIGETEVTQALWQAVMGSNPSSFKGDNRPVENVSWDDCKTFISKLNSITSQNFRLPTEAEWEYAAKGGNESQGYEYSGCNKEDDLEQYAWYDKNAYYCWSDSRNSNHPDYGTHPVKTKKSNELGLYDMSGNVFEWCEDLYNYSSGPLLRLSSSRYGHVIRGGNWCSNAWICRVSISRGYRSDLRLDSMFIGLRLAL